MTTRLIRRRTHRRRIGRYGYLRSTYAVRPKGRRDATRRHRAPPIGSQSYGYLKRPPERNERPMRLKFRTLWTNPARQQFCSANLSSLRNPMLGNLNSQRAPEAHRTPHSRSTNLRLAVRLGYGPAAAVDTEPSGCGDRSKFARALGMRLRTGMRAAGSSRWLTRFAPKSVTGMLLVQHPISRTNRRRRPPSRCA